MPGHHLDLSPMTQPAYNYYTPGGSVPPPPASTNTGTGTAQSKTNDTPQTVPGGVGRWFWLIKGAEAILHIAVLAVKLYSELMTAIAT